jgi:murein DD-endopeptidase MepM/ murein hydrolase activator NlpD
VSTDTDSALLSADDESCAQNPNQPLSRRELRLRADQEKVEQIARGRERDRIRANALKRADEIRREKEATEAREAETQRFQEQIDRGRQALTPSKASSSAIDVNDATAGSDIATTSYAERGHGGARRRRAEKKLRKKSEAAAKRTSRLAERKKHIHPLRNALGRSFVVVVVGGLFAVLALPATGFDATNTGWATATTSDDQSVNVATTGTEAEQVALGQFSVTTYSDLLLLTYGLTSGFTYSVTNSGKIQWPFPVVVPISSGFGGRSAPCLGCSSNHQGLDFDPADGTAFNSVADGEVVEVNDDGYLGKWVVIRHDIDGLKFDSLYAHMIRDSTGVEVGQQVKAGDYIGRVGNTGVTSGAHLHLAIIVDGVHIDPFEFLKKHTKGN